MKTLLLTLIAVSGTAFASNIQVNSKNHNMQEPAKKESKGHWTVSLGTQFHNVDPKNPIVQVLVGYQSAAEKSKFFQAQRIEFGGGCSLNTLNSSGFYPKFTGIHYFNFDSNTRYYFNIGGALGSHCYSQPEEKSYENHEGKTVTYDGYTHTCRTFIMGSTGVGIEVGELNGTINCFELSIDQPALFFGKEAQAREAYNPSARLSYTVGF